MSDQPRPFTVDDRNLALGKLTAYAAGSPEMLGTLLVGSGASGFNDDYSDLDIVYVVEPMAFSIAFDAIMGFVRQELQPVFSTTYQHRDDVFVVSIVLTNYLEIDIGVWSIDSLFASSPNWRVVQQRDEKTGSRLETAMRDHSPLERKHPPRVTGDDPLWQPIHGRFMAKLRSNGSKTAQHQRSLDAKLVELHVSERDLMPALRSTYTTTQSDFLATMLDSQSNTLLL